MKNGKARLPLSTTLHAFAPALRWPPPPRPFADAELLRKRPQDTQLKQTETSPSGNELELDRLVARGWGADSAAVVVRNCRRRSCLCSTKRRRVVWHSQGRVIGKQGLHGAKPDVAVRYQLVYSSQCCVSSLLIQQTVCSCRSASRTGGRGILTCCECKKTIYCERESLRERAAGLSCSCISRRRGSSHAN